MHSLSDVFGSALVLGCVYGGLGCMKLAVVLPGLRLPCRATFLMVHIGVGPQVYSRNSTMW